MIAVEVVVLHPRLQVTESQGTNSVLVSDQEAGQIIQDAIRKKEGMSIPSRRCSDEGG